MVSGRLEAEADGPAGAGSEEFDTARHLFGHSIQHIAGRGVGQGAQEGGQVGDLGFAHIATVRQVRRKGFQDLVVEVPFLEDRLTVEVCQVRAGIVSQALLRIEVMPDDIFERVDDAVRESLTG